MIGGVGPALGAILASRLGKNSGSGADIPDWLALALVFLSTLMVIGVISYAVYRQVTAGV